MRLGKRRAVVVEAQAAFDREPTAGPAVLRKQAHFADAPCQLIRRRELGDLIGRTVVEPVLDTGVVEAVETRIGAVEQVGARLEGVRTGHVRQRAAGYPDEWHLLFRVDTVLGAIDQPGE